MDRIGNWRRAWLEGKLHCETSALSSTASRGESSSVRGGYVLGQGQADSHALLLSFEVIFLLMERAEDALHRLRHDSRTIVRHRDRESAVRGSYRFYLNLAFRLGELHRVGYEMMEGAAEQVPVPTEGSTFSPAHERQLQRFRICRVLVLPRDLFDPVERVEF